MTRVSGAAFIQGSGLGMLLGGQIVAYEFLEPVSVVLIAGVVLLTGMLLESHAGRTDKNPNGE